MEKLLGYNGKIAYIDLSTIKVEIKDLDPKIAEDYIGGVGLSAKLTYDLLSDEDYATLREDPFSDINPLIFATGPLTGTSVPSSGRYSVTVISPLTGIWGESTSGGFLPIALRKCGFDAIVITGKAEEPKFIVVNNGEIEFKDAKMIWGKNTRETMDIIKKELNDENLRIACIGKAGENLVKYAAIINDEGRAAGRCGVGTIMGKKKLKALVVKGSEKIEFADRKAIIKSSKSAIANMKNTFIYNFMNHYGTLCYTDIGAVFGDVPANYFTSTDFVFENLTGRALKEQYTVLSYACAGCQIGCGRTTIAELDGKEVEIDGPEFETAMAFGPLCGIIDFKPILEANHICNLEGIDTISGGVSISFLIYLIKNNIAIDNISKYLSDIKLEEITWGNDQIIIKLLNKIINRDGIGDILAEGVKIMAEKFGVDPDLAAHVKGLEMPMHDPRAYLGQALTYMTCCCGANHMKGDFYGIDSEFGSFGKIRKADRFTINGREPIVIALQDLRNVFDSAVICDYSFINLATFTKVLKASTGFASLGNKKKLFLAGERATNLKRLISCKLGCKREDDYLPKILTQALESGGSAGIKIELENNLKTYYQIRGWDWETGWPTKEKLDELGI